MMGGLLVSFDSPAARLAARSSHDFNAIHARAVQLARTLAKWRVRDDANTKTERSATRIACSVCFLATTTAAHAESALDSPFASTVIAYTAGSGAAAGFTNPSVALGSPERFTGEGFLPQCVTPFQPAFRPNEVVSVGLGGSLVVAFDHDVIDDPRNPFGIDLLVFGNAFFTDLGGGAGVVGGLASEGGRISVSSDGVTWFQVVDVAADGLFPTVGYVDAAPYATVPGKIASDFLRPVNPTLTVGDLVGLDHAALLEVYDGSGGGAGVDIGALGLQSIRYVRVDGPTAIGFSPEVDAFADVAPLAPNADLDDSGTVDATDLALLLASWGTTAPAFDLDADGIIGAGDLALLLSAWNGGGS
jgi:hypothetical protein